MWGAIAGVLHVIPYVGSALTAVAVGIAAFLQFGTLGAAAGAASRCSPIAAALGMGFMSWLHGRTTQVNAVAVFVALLFFGWLWGGWGLLAGRAAGVDRQDHRRSHSRARAGRRDARP